MKPVATVNTNDVLKKPEGMTEYDCVDLPITRVKFENGMDGIESCWELSPEELKEIIKTGRVYLILLGSAQPPATISVSSCVTSVGEEQKEN